MRLLSFPLLILLCYACQDHSIVNNTINGAWSIEKIIWKSKDTTIQIAPQQKGILLITQNYYGISWSPIREKRTPFENLSSPTEEEIVKGFQSIVFNSGTYCIDKNILTTTAQIAKVPGFEGGKQYYHFAHTNETQLKLTLYDETYPSGKKPQWLGKWETTFIMEKL